MRAFVIAVLLVSFVLPAAADMAIFEYAPINRSYDPTWPPDGATWHGIHPGATFCALADQTDHDDADGNGQIDACESIQLDGVWRHVEWIGPTITITYLTDGSRVPVMIEPVTEPGRPPAPVEYHVVYPEDAFCTTIVTDVPITDVCQIVTIIEPPEYAGPWHVEEIATNIHVGSGSPVERSTWAKIKNIFGLF
jgi:hypothetical protein